MMGKLRSLLSSYRLPACLAADRGLHHRIDVAGRQIVARGAGPIDVDAQR